MEQSPFPAIIISAFSSYNKLPPALDSAKVNSIALQACRPASPSAQQPSQAITQQLHSLSDNTELSRVNSRLTRPDVPDSAQSKVLSSPELPKVRKIPC